MGFVRSIRFVLLSKILVFSFFLGGGSVKCIVYLCMYQSVLDDFSGFAFFFLNFVVVICFFAFSTCDLFFSDVLCIHGLSLMYLCIFAG